VQRLAEGGPGRDRGDRRHHEQQRGDGAGGVRAQDLDERQQRHDAHAPGQPRDREHELSRHVEPAAADRDDRGQDRTGGHRLDGDRDARVGDADPALLQHGAERQAEDAHHRDRHAGADARAAELRRQADRHADDADRQARPQPRVAALLAAGDRHHGGDHRREPEHHQRAERGRDVEREAAVDAAELHDLQEHPDGRETAERGAAPAPVPERERDGDERGEGEPGGEQRKRVGPLDRQRADDIAGAPEQDEDRQEETIGHAVSLLVRRRVNNPSRGQTDADP